MACSCSSRYWSRVRHLDVREVIAERALDRRARLLDVTGRLHVDQCVLLVAPEAGVVCDLRDDERHREPAGEVRLFVDRRDAHGREAAGELHLHLVARIEVVLACRVDVHEDAVITHVGEAPPLDAEVHDGRELARIDAGHRLLVAFHPDAAEAERRDRFERGEVAETAGHL